MDISDTEKLDQLMEEVFYQEDRNHAELRLFPSEAKHLARQYHVEYRPMDGSVCKDGKIWYDVWLPG